MVWCFRIFFMKRITRTESEGFNIWAATKLYTPMSESHSKLLLKTSYVFFSTSREKYYLNIFNNVVMAYGKVQVISHFAFLAILSMVIWSYIIRIRYFLKDTISSLRSSHLTYSTTESSSLCHVLIIRKILLLAHSVSISNTASNYETLP